MAIDRSVVIFYYERLHASGQPCFDARVDGEALPGGAIVAAFMCGGDQKPQQAFFWPRLTEAQEEQLNKLLSVARTYVEHPDSVGSIFLHAYGVRRDGQKRGWAAMRAAAK